jgi:hypothetical protein
MTKQSFVVKITYEHKDTLERHDVSFKYALDASHALKIAKKLRPKRCKIVSVVAFPISQESGPLPDEWPSDLN